MLYNISWATFLTTLLIIAVLYYIVIVILFYRRELTTFLARIQGKQISVISPTYDTADMISVMGSANEGPYPVPSRFSRETPVAEKEKTASDVTLIGAVSDVMEGAKTLLRAIKDEEKKKEDMLALFPTLLADYPQIAASRYRYSINAFIHEICTAEYGYDLSINEVDGLWPTEQFNQS